MILSIAAYEDELEIEQGNPYISAEIDSNDLTEVILALRDVLDAAGYEFPAGWQLGYEQKDDNG